MGTDITMYAEKKVNGKWEPVKEYFMNPIYSIETNSVKMIPTDEVYDERNYSFFNILAGVRERFECDHICKTFGVPNDASESMSRRFSSDFYHSVGYVTLTELLAFNWDSQVEIQKVCNFRNFKDWYLHGGEIGIYCTFTSEKTISQEEAIRIIENDPNLDSGDFYVRAVEQHSFKNIAGRFYSHHIPKLCQLSISECDGNSDNVRIIFGFDS